MAAVAGSSVNVAVVFASAAAGGGTEWIWRDAVRDERRSATYPDNPALDLTELRLTGDSANLYILARLRNLTTSLSPATSTLLPAVFVGFDFDRGTNSGAQKFHTVDVTKFDTLLTPSDSRWERAVLMYQATPGTGTVFAHSPGNLASGATFSFSLGSTSGGTGYGNGYGHALGTGGFIESSVPWSAIGGSDKFLGKTVSVVAAVFWNLAAAPGGTLADVGQFAAFESGASSATDVMSPVTDSFLTTEGPAGFASTGTAGTWAEVRDGKLGFSAYVTFDGNGNPVAPPKPILNPGKVQVDGVPATGGGLAEVVVGRAPVFSWILSSSGTIGAGAVRIQVGRDAAALAAGSPDIWDAGVSLSTADSSVRYAGPALLAGKTYYWRLLYMDAAGTSSGWSPTGRFLALGAAIPIAAGDDLIVDWNNPFNPLAGEVTKLRYVVREVPKKVTLRIYGITGGLVRTLELDRDAAPNAVQSVVWDGRNEEGQVVASGMYLVHMITNPEGTTITKKIVVVK